MNWNVLCLIAPSYLAPHITLEDIAVGPCPFRELPQGSVAAIAFAGGVGVGDETTLADGADDVAERMVDDTVPVGCSGDEPRLGF